MSRKYRQRGYQDEERRHDEAPRRRPQADGPRGRSSRRPTEVVFRCARCGARQELDRRVELDELCPGCGADLHTCTNCCHFDTDAPRECRLDVPVRIVRKSTRNECESFEVKQAVEAGDSQRGEADARAAFDALFDL